MFGEIWHHEPTTVPLWHRRIRLDLLNRFWQGFRNLLKKIIMKKNFRKLVSIALILALVIFLLPGCYETHYYHHYHHHTRGWYDHRHRPYPAGVNFDIDVYKR